MKTASLNRLLVCGTCSWLIWATPSEARFLQADPVGYQDQTNLYAYVGNDPVNRTDPTGRWECKGGSSDCSKIRMYRAELGMAARTARAQAGGRIMSPMARMLMHTDRHLGAEGGGVEISNASLEQSTLGDTDSAGNIRLDLAQIERAEASGQMNGAGVLGHEGSHSLMGRTRGPISSARDTMDRELIGYGVQSIIDQHLYSTGGRSQMWHPGMADAKRRRIIWDQAYASCIHFLDASHPLFSGQNCGQ